jgi:hypothetical protein
MCIHEKGASLKKPSALLMDDPVSSPIPGTLTKQEIECQLLHTYTTTTTSALIHKYHGMHVHIAYFQEEKIKELFFHKLLHYY